MSRRRTLVAVLLILSAVLHGCGGGSTSNGSASATSSAAFPVDSVVSELAAQGGSFIAFAGGQVGGQPYVVSYIPVRPGKYTRNATVTGPNLAAASATVDFQVAPFSVTGWIDEKLNPAAQLQVTPAPLTAKVGDRGMLMAGQQYISRTTG